MNKVAAFLLSSALALGACAKNAVPERSTLQKARTTPLVTQPDKPQHDIQAETAKLRALVKKQNVLVQGMQEMHEMQPRAAQICEGAYQQCSESVGALIKKNIPEDVMAQCQGTLFDPENTFIDNEMLHRRMVGPLIEVYEAGNACLDSIVNDCGRRAVKAIEIMDRPDEKAKAEQAQQKVIQTRLSQRSSLRGGQSSSDRAACNLIAKKNTNREAERLRELFYSDPTFENYQKYMESLTAEMKAKEQCYDAMDKEKHGSPEMKKLLLVTAKYLVHADTEKYSECTSSDPQYKALTDTLSGLVEEYTAQPTIDRRLQYLKTEISQQQRLNACIAEKQKP